MRVRLGQMRVISAFQDFVHVVVTTMVVLKEVKPTVEVAAPAVVDAATRSAMTHARRNICIFQCVMFAYEIAHEKNN